MDTEGLDIGKKFKTRTCKTCKTHFCCFCWFPLRENPKGARGACFPKLSALSKCGSYGLYRMNNQDDFECALRVDSRESARPQPGEYPIQIEAEVEGAEQG